MAAGKILANQLTTFLGDDLRKFRDREKLILGICNGFQALLKAGLLVPPDEDGPLATLTHNAHGYFEDRWIHLQATPGQLPVPEGHRPAASCRSPTARATSSAARSGFCKGLEQTGPGRPALRGRRRPAGRGGFPDNPNGSQGDVAGVCDATGRVLGLMPHPERHVLRRSTRAGRARG